jgi:hypothetical protein
VRLTSTLNSIFELAVSLRQLRHYLICATRGITIEDGGLQKYASTELELCAAVCVEDGGWNKVRMRLPFARDELGAIGTL